MAHCVHTMLAEVRTSWENWNPTPMPSFPVPPASIQSMAVQSSRPSHPIQEEVDKEGRQKKAKSHPLAAKHLRKSTSNSAHPSSVHFGAFWHRVDGHLPCLWPNVHSPPSTSPTLSSHPLMVVSIRRVWCPPVRQTILPHALPQEA